MSDFVPSRRTDMTRAEIAAWARQLSNLQILHDDAPDLADLVADENDRRARERRRCEQYHATRNS